MAVCEECITIDIADSAPRTGCPAAFSQLHLQPSQVVGPYVNEASAQQRRPQPRLTGPGPVRHLGPSGHQFYQREILKKAPYHRKEHTAIYKKRPNVFQARCWAEQQKQKEEHRRAIRQAIVEDIRRKFQPTPQPGQLPNGICWPPYDPAEFKLAYHHRACRAQVRGASEASAEGSNALSVLRPGASVGSDASKA